MNTFKSDGNGLRAALAIVCESEELAARLRISLISNSSQGVIFEALMGGYLKRTKRLLQFKLILFLVKTTIGHAFGYCFRFLCKTKHSKARLTRL